ncbi:MAG: c-type cytochrome, partial [Flavobacteriales bacterium]|nr:c-type cytochrome [Flavobacteriales bacterium]
STSFPDYSNIQDVTVLEIWDEVGAEMPDHFLKTLDSVEVQRGYDLVHIGRTNNPPKGEISTFISPYFVCTDCHNQVLEDPFPAKPNPEDRLTFAIANNLPFLQATTFYGIVNREDYYNDDYIKKYGDLVIPASTSLYESTQLCAQECSSGRKIKEWEWNAINQYYHSIQLKVSDLNMDAEEVAMVEEAYRGEADPEAAIELMREHYMTKSPARFKDENTRPLTDHRPGNPETGELIYEMSCLHCHQVDGPSQLVLDKSRLTKKKFQRNYGKWNDWDLNQIVRKGTYAELGHQQYMPLYTLDRLSQMQMIDLKAYLLER